MKITVNDITIIRDHYGATGRWWVLRWDAGAGAYRVVAEHWGLNAAKQAVEAAGKTRVLLDPLTQKALTFDAGSTGYMTTDKFLEDE